MAPGRRDPRAGADLPRQQVEIVDSAVPDGRWLLVATTARAPTQPRRQDADVRSPNPGYEEFEDVRTRVGRADPPPQALWLADVATGKVRELKFDPLPGIASDPLAALRKAAGREPLKGNRPVQVATSGDNGDAPTLLWTADGRSAAVMVRAIDNKDRWIATVDTAAGVLQPATASPTRRGSTGASTILAGCATAATLWYRRSPAAGRTCTRWMQASSMATAAQLTDGRWETSQVVPARDGNRLPVRLQPRAPDRLRSLQRAAGGGEVRELTALDGVENFALSPDGSRLLLVPLRGLPAAAAVGGGGSGRAGARSPTPAAPTSRRATGSSRSRCRCRAGTAPGPSGASSTARRIPSRAGSTRW